jgi:hypothetical protein
MINRRERLIRRVSVHPQLPPGFQGKPFPCSEVLFHPPGVVAVAGVSASNSDYEHHYQQTIATDHKLSQFVDRPSGQWSENSVSAKLDRNAASQGLSRKFVNALVVTLATTAAERIFMVACTRLSRLAGAGGKEKRAA